MEQETTKSLTSQDQQLEQQLTKRNSQFVFDLKKALSSTNFTAEKQEQALHDILVQLVDGQKKGITARQLFGTATECVESLQTKPKVEENKNTGLVILDNSLFLFFFLALMTGGLSLLSKSTNTMVYGIITMILVSVSGGYIFYLMDKYIYQYSRPGADKSKRPKMVKIIAILVGAFFLWFILFALATMIPTSINIQLDPITNIVLAALAFGVRYLLKRKYNIKGTIMR